MDVAILIQSNTMVDDCFDTIERYATLSCMNQSAKHAFINEILYTLNNNKEIPNIVNNTQSTRFVC